MRTFFCAILFLVGYIAGCGGEAKFSPAPSSPAPADYAVAHHRATERSPAPAATPPLPAVAARDENSVVGNPVVNSEAYDRIVDNNFLPVNREPLSTFSIDVDTASYANVRRFLTQGQLPPKAAVRIEELINYFSYDYPPPQGDVPFSASIEVAECPWNTAHRLARVGLKGKEIAAYRLIGYENRLLNNEDFHNDKKDAGEIGAGHTVTALYELVPAGQEVALAGAGLTDVGPLKYQKAVPLTVATESDELLTLRLRYKQPDAASSRLIEFPVMDRAVKFSQASSDLAWSAAVASFGMILRDSPHKGNSTLASVLEIADSNRGADAAGYRAEFVQLVRTAQSLGAGR